MAMFAGLGMEQPIGLTLFTDAFIVRGTVRTRHRRITDVLNGDEPFVVLEEVTIDEFGSRELASRAEFAQINLDTVLFAVGDTPVEPAPELRMPKVQEPALISVPPFKITGILHLLPSGDLRERLTELTGRFIPVTDATYWSEKLGEAQTKAMVVAFNHSRAHIMTPHKVVDPWSGLGTATATAPNGSDTAPGGGW